MILFATIALLTFKDGICDSYCRLRRNMDHGQYVATNKCRCFVDDEYKDAVEKPFTLRFSREVDQEEDAQDP